MSRKEDLPEDAQKEPRTLTPAEEAERARRRYELVTGGARGRDWAAPQEPLRMPGELSSPAPAALPRRPNEGLAKTPRKKED